MSETTTIDGFVYFIQLNGLYGRKRKPVRETNTLIAFSQELTPDAIDTVTKQYLADINAKPGLQYQVIADPVKRKTENGFTVTMGTVALGAARNIVVKGIV